MAPWGRYDNNPPCLTLPIGKRMKIPVKPETQQVIKRATRPLIAKK